MAELGAPILPQALPGSRQQFSTIAWLRWRIFVNSLRMKGATGELVVRVLSYPFVALMVLGPATGAGVGAWYFTSRGMLSYLAIPLWIIFALWQFIGVSTSTTGPSFDLSTLVRFPLRYRDYLLIRLSFGLLDIPTLAGAACLLAMTIGIAVAAPTLLPSAATALLLYLAANILFSRMVYSWFERWLAQRRTRELLTALILVFSLAIQFGSQFLQRINFTHHHHAPTSPLMLKATGALLAINMVLPPGLATSVISAGHDTSWNVAIASLAGLILYCVAFLLILHIRLQAQYRGENLSEAPSTGRSKTKTSGRRVQTVTHLQSTASGRAGLVSPPVRACFEREIRYLLRSGTKLYTLIMPVFMILLFSFRSAGMDHFGVGHGSASFLFSYGCAYTQLILVALLYNSLGNDGSGIQFYFIAPVRFRDIILAKNLLTGAILVVELILMYIVAAIVSVPASLALTAATVAWMLFAVLLNMSIGNVRSILSPKVVEGGNVRRQNVSGMNSLISLAVVVACVLLGAGSQLLCTYLNIGYWPAAGFFLGLSGIAFAVYISVLGRLDSIAMRHQEELIRQLCKV